MIFNYLNKARSFAFFILLVSSCQKEQIIPDTGRKLIINGLFTTDSLLGINITNSIYILDTVKWFETDIINNAKATVYINNIELDSLFFKFIRPSYYNELQIPLNYISKSLLPQTGVEYKITIKAPGFPDAYATTKVPDLVKIEKIDTTKVILDGTFEDYESNIRYVCNIEFKDPIDEANYYLIYVYRKENDGSARIMQFECQDPSVEEELNHGSIPFGVAFSDKSINGKKNSLQLVLNGIYIGWPFFFHEYPDYKPYKTTIIFRLYTISKEYFDYIHTLNLFFKNYKNPLVEPTQVYSNIQGGYGIFAGAAVSCDSIVFKE